MYPRLSTIRTSPNDGHTVIFVGFDERPLVASATMPGRAPVRMASARRMEDIRRCSAFSG